MEIIYDWNQETQQAKCIITDKNLLGIGEAKCHSKDMDVSSEKTGLYIAEQRAVVHFLQNKKEVKLKPALSALNHLYSTIKYSKQFNTNSYEAKRIRKEIKNLQKEIYQINCSIDLIKQRLKQYINDKDKMANLYRTKQKIKESNNDN